MFKVISGAPTGRPRSACSARGSGTSATAVCSCAAAASSSSSTATTASASASPARRAASTSPTASTRTPTTSRRTWPCSRTRIAALDADVLALKVGNAAAGSSNNFLTCFAGNSAVGSIEGNGTGISFNSTSADFAECLPRLDPAELLEPGDVVGVIRRAHHEGDGRRSPRRGHRGATDRRREQTVGAATAPLQRRRVHRPGTHARPRPGVRRRSDRALGRHDGTGIAVPADDADACLDVIGTAWETADGEGVHEIAAVVGLQRRRT